MTLIQGFLWLCCVAVVFVSLVGGFLGFVAVKKMNSMSSPWPLMCGIFILCLALQAGYVVAPLVLRAEGDWWLWAVYGMAPLALGSFMAVGANLVFLLRRLLHRRQASAEGAGTRIFLAAQGAVYIGAPLVVWLSRA